MTKYCWGHWRYLQVSASNVTETLLQTATPSELLLGKDTAEEESTHLRVFKIRDL